MKRDEHKILVLSVAAGLSLWVIDAAIDSLFFSKGPFLGEILVNADVHEIYFRGFFLTGFVLFGLVVSRLISKRNRIQDELKKAVELVEEEKAKSEAIVAAIGDGISIQDREFKVLYQNQVHRDIVGGDKTGQQCHKAYSHSESACEGCPVAQSFEDGEIHMLEKTTIRNNEPLHVEIKASPLRDSTGAVVAGIETVRDITRRKRTEERLRRTARALKVISECSQAVVHATEETKLLRNVCRIVVGAGYRLAWVGSAMQNEGKTIKPIAQAGVDEGYLEKIGVTWSDTERGRGPAGTAIRTGAPSLTRDVETDPKFGLWREEALKRGYRAVIGLPLNVDGKITGVLTIYAPEPDAFDEEEVRLLTEMANNVSYGIKALRLSGQRKRAEEALQRAYGELEVLVQARTSELMKTSERLRNLSAHLQAVREEERTGIAREIHDELGQVLTALKMDLSWMATRHEDQLLSGKAKSMVELVDSTIKTVKRICSDLRPGVLDDLGLVAAMEWQTEEFRKRAGIHCVTSFTPRDIALDKDRSTAIFRIFQEALTNVMRHAGATRVKIGLEDRNGEIVISIEDNGRGITEEQISDPRSFGLIGIRERANFWGGKAVISGMPDKGTSLTINIPRA